MTRAALLISAIMFTGALAGCQSIGAKMDSLAAQGWNSTRATVTKVATKLRPAPADAARFVHVGETGDAGLNTHLLEERIWVAGLNAGEPLVVREAVNRTLDNGVMVYRPGSGSRTVGRRMQPAPAYSAPVYSAPQPTADPYSYVRLDGPTDMRDWASCEARTGGAFIVTPAAVTIAGDFDACMRAKGYLPETEAERRLDMAGGVAGGVAGLRGTSRP